MLNLFFIRKTIGIITTGIHALEKVKEDGSNIENRFIIIFTGDFLG
jgi:hypothetical protein